MERLNLFSLQADRAYAQRVAQNLAIPLSDHEEREFEDQEHKIRPLVNVRGNHVYVVQSLYSAPQWSVNDKLCRLLFFIGALKDAGAERVTAVVPYLCYARKDRKTKPYDPVTSRYVACLFEAVGTDRVVTLDVHNLAAFQNAFRCRTEHLHTAPLFARHLAAHYPAEDLVVLSPDTGGVKRADAVREKLSKLLNRVVPLAIMEKQRSMGVLSGEAVLGEFTNKTVVILDDLISSGSTLARAARLCKEREARKVIAVATHGVFSEKSEAVLSQAELDGLIVTNTIPPFRLSQAFLDRNVTVLDTAPLVAEAIRRIHTGGSLEALLEEE